MLSPLCFSLAATASVAVQVAPGASDDPLVAAITELVEARAAEDRFSGTVAVARDGELLVTVAVGEASKRFHVPNRVDTKFNLGSMNKMFTSVAVMQLVEQGKVALDDPLSKYADETWLAPGASERIQVRHLLAHTSGLGSYFTDAFFETSRTLYREVDDYKPLVREDAPAFEPGSRYAYSNTGMLMLGVVIESASGESYFDYVRAHVTGPAGMTNTDCYDMDQPVENLAIGYEADATSAQGYRNNLFLHSIRGGPAGGGFSTSPDLVKFAQALLDGTLVSVESLDAMWTDQVHAGYGFGFGVRETELGKVVGHSGGFPGINSNLDICLDNGFVIAVMSNYSQGVGAVAPGIRRLIAEHAD